MFFDTPAFDLLLLKLINQQGHTWLLNDAMRLLSSRIALFAVLVPAVLLLVKRHGRKQLMLFLLLLVSMGLTDMATSQVKDSIQRVRPLHSVAGTYYVDEGQWLRLPPDFVQTKTKGSSYPSGHAANIACLATLCLLLWPKTRPWLAGLPLAVGYSRIYLGKHFPSDVLAGWLFGLTIAVLIWLVWKRWLEALVFKPDAEKLL
ncbi:MAG: phosphatase PAP2 family protein [Desulfovibrionaceae bacterium]